MSTFTEAVVENIAGIGLSEATSGEGGGAILVELFTSLENSFLVQARLKAEVSAAAAAESLALATKCRQALDYSLSVITGYGLRLPQFDTTAPVIQGLASQQKDIQTASKKPPRYDFNTERQPGSLLGKPLDEVIIATMSSTPITSTELVIVKPPTEIAGSVPGVVIDVATGWHRINSRYRDQVAGYHQNGHGTTELIPAGISGRLAPAEPSLPSDEKELVNLAKTGDQRAFTALYQKYESAIFNYVYRTMGDRQDALDMTQDTFLKAYKALPKTSDDLRLEAWLYRIASNVCLDELRHRKLVKWTPWADFVTVFHPSQVAKDNPEKDVIHTENTEEVLLILEEMHPKYRMALILREYHDLSYDEITEVLGTTKASVKSTLFRAREKFRQVYAKVERKPGKIP